MGDTLGTVNLGADKTVKAISAGAKHTCAILNDDTLKCWGYDGYGQLGYGDYTTRNTPDAVVNLGSGKTAKAISAGNGYTCAILNDDSLKCWGLHDNGRLGVPPSETTVCDGSSQCVSTPHNVSLGSGKTAKIIVAKKYHTCLILNDNSVRCAGENGQGQLGGYGDTVSYYLDDEGSVIVPLF